MIRALVPEKRNHMGYSVYYTGEITISPELDADRATLLDDALRTHTLERTRQSPPMTGGICVADAIGRYSDGCLNVEGESRDGREGWLRLLVAGFFQTERLLDIGEVSWDDDQSGDTGVIYVEEDRIRKR